MDVLQSLLENYNIPILSALILGLMTAISPCPLATNITATAFISKNISSKRKVILSGLLYALGRSFSYTTIGLILYFGASKFHIARFFNQNGEKFLGMLIPMTITSAEGLYLPIVFAFGTGLPVIVFTYLLAYTAGKVGFFYNKITKIEKVMRVVAGVVFIITGLYYVAIFTGILN